MKKLIVLFGMLMMQQNMAQALPVCSEEPGEMTYPCLAPANEAGFAVADMLFDNADGFAQVKAKAKLGFEVDDLRVTLLSETEKTVEIKYELLLRDCRGTDACYGSQVWTVIAKITGDGYSSSSTYTDTLVPADSLPVIK